MFLTLPFLIVMCLLFFALGIIFTLLMFLNYGYENDYPPPPEVDWNTRNQTTGIRDQITPSTSAET